MEIFIGCGKSMLAKAVARHTTGKKIGLNWLFSICLVVASFIRVVGSEFVQKYLGEGPRMVRDVFRLAKGKTILCVERNSHGQLSCRKFSCDYLYR